MKISGCTVHFADDTYDTGPIIVQRPVPVLENDTVDTLAARVFKEECNALPEAISIVRGRPAQARWPSRPCRVHGLTHSARLDVVTDRSQQ